MAKSCLSRSVLQCGTCIFLCSEAPQAAASSPKDPPTPVASPPKAYQFSNFPVGLPASLAHEGSKERNEQFRLRCKRRFA